MVADFTHNDGQIEEYLSSTQELVPTAIQKAKLVKGFPGRWKMIISKLEQIPSRLSDLSSHPCFSKNSLCKEQLQSISKTLKETISLADETITGGLEAAGKLRIQSDLDALIGKLDLNLRDCGLLIKTGMLVDSVSPTVSELLARLQIGHLESKQKALDTLVEIMNEDEITVISVLGRSNIAALVQLLTATSNRMRETTVSVICSLTESSENCESWLVSEGVLPPLIRLVESGSSVGKEKAVMSLQRLSLTAETARSIVGHGGVQPLIEISENGGDSVVRSLAACTLRNISNVPDLRQPLADEGVVRLMVSLLNGDMGSKEYAAECLQNLTSTNDDLRQAVISAGGVLGILAFLDRPTPKEPAVGVLRNLVDLVATENLITLGLIPRLVHVLRTGSSCARQVAASIICRVCGSIEMKKLMGEAGCIPLLINMLEAKTNNAREVAAQAISSLVVGHLENRREFKKDAKSVPSLVQLLEPSEQNTAKKYAILCLFSISNSKRCKKVMISYGAIGYLKKLNEMGVPGAKKLLERLDRGKFKSLFSRK
ncbi:protein CELLULOSE SYNTHASE INTERACTIVE 3-like [Impatiens glandulifera]|uniref:protein CELLULOSE SYNTHASE INTERACTIVE 3-like n=1 Tax=Impatiens glandulifera TaxID=253017 RepID=UPI001FB12B40|nr:protein CELLULOSE SYNTHASE INTERACTIVE 3-like [Impatiens glandulifera]XP_047323182.1 protein CELLULOSE SYNTHASE INTERACTIVE 3-like [Impatiens glandulifera]